MAAPSSTAVPHDFADEDRRWIGYHVFVKIGGGGDKVEEAAKTYEWANDDLVGLIEGRPDVADAFIGVVLAKLGMPMAEATQRVAQRAAETSELSPSERRWIAWQLEIRRRRNKKSINAIAKSLNKDGIEIRRVLRFEAASRPSIEAVAAALNTDIRTLCGAPADEVMPSGQRPPSPTAPISPARSVISDRAAPAASDGAPRRARRSALVVAGVAAAGVLAMVGMRLSWKQPYVTLHAPYRITENEAAVFGEHDGGPDAMVVLYVRPAGSQDHYRQDPSELLVENGRYQARIRFGNERQADPTVSFRVTAFLVPIGNTGKLPGDFAQPQVKGDSEEAFLARMRAHAIAFSEAATVTRVAARPDPEHVRLVEPRCRSRSPVLVAWEPRDQPLYLEVRRLDAGTDSSTVSGATGPERRSGLGISLPVGSYEMKLRRSPSDPVLHVWECEVVP